jgi:hypothetical protein
MEKLCLAPQAGGADDRPLRQVCELLTLVGKEGIPDILP